LPRGCAPAAASVKSAKRSTINLLEILGVLFERGRAAGRVGRR